MEHEYIVKTQFAVNDTVYNVDDIVEMEAEEAKQFVADGKLDNYVEEKTVNLEVNTEAIQKAIESGFAKFAPKPQTEEKKMSFGEFLVGVARKTINITTAAQGANATTTFTDPAIDSDILEQSGIVRLANVVNLSSTNNVYRFNIVSSVGTAPGVVAESTAVTLSQPLIATVTLTLVKVVYAYTATEEALQDTGALTNEINSVVPEAFAKFIEGGMINGATGLTAIVGHAQTTSVAAEVGQTAATINDTNVNKMYSSLKNPSRSVWVMSRSAWTAVQGLEDSNGNALFVGPRNYGDSPFGSLKGIPILLSDFCQAIGTVGDIIAGDFSKYKIASKGGLNIARSDELKFLENESVFRFTQRLAGAPAGLKLTATDGTTISDFITLAERA